VVARFETLSAMMEAAHPTAPHWYLGAVATLPEKQGRGLGAAILAPVLEDCDREGVPSYLESSNARNLPFYFRQGWLQTGEIEIPDGPVLFPMWREPRVG
jgi:GNAT superfamily N-acetyltransferase